MKFYYICGVIAFVVIVSYVKANHMDDLKAFALACRHELHTSKEDLDAYFNNGMKETDVTEGIKCYIKCFIEKQGHFRNGQFDEQGFLQSLQTVPAFKDRKEELLKAADECKNEMGDNDCETAFKVTMCFKNKRAVMN